MITIILYILLFALPIIPAYVFRAKIAAFLRRTYPAKALGYIWSISEWLLIPLGIYLFVKSQVILRWLDPTAAALDTGAFHLLIFGIVACLFAFGVFYAIIRLRFDWLFHYLDKNAIFNDFKKLTPFHRIVSAFMFSALVLGSIVFILSMAIQ